MSKDFKGSLIFCTKDEEVYSNYYEIEPNIFCTKDLVHFRSDTVKI